MTDTSPIREFRFKKGSSIMNYIHQFSSTEKAVFGVFALVALVTVLIMAGKVNSYFMVEIPANGGNLREGVVGLPRTINPVLAVTDVDKDISSLVYSGLMRYSGNNIVPDLAETYKVSSDGLTYTFKLRDDVRFQDGKSLTAEDVSFTIQKIQDPALKSPRRADWMNVTTKVISPTEIQFTLKQPYGPFLTNTTVGIIPKHIWNNINNEQFIFSKYNIEAVGSGPYKVDSITRDSGDIPSQYRITTWRSYRDTTPYLSSITFSFFADEESALKALDNGSIDSLAAVSPAEASKLISNSAQAYRVLDNPLPRIFGVFFNQGQNAALADINVRKALNMSVDREAIVKSVLYGYGLPIDGPLPTSTDKIVTKRDIVGAQALLEKNGWKKDLLTGIYQYQKKGSKNIQVLSFDIYTADTPDLKQAANMIKNDWTKLGATVNIKIFEPSDLYQNIIRTRKYDALLFGELIGKDRDFYAFWHSSQRNAPGLNVSLYTNSKVDKLLETIRTENDVDVRTRKYAELNELITDDVPAIFLYSPNFIYVIPKILRGIELKNVTLPVDRWNSVFDWYTTTERVWKIFAK